MTANAGCECSTIVITSGGTGGHLFPAQALAEELQRRKHKIVLITDERGFKWRDQFPQIRLHMTMSGTTEPSGIINRLRAIFLLAIGTVQAWLLLGKYRPRVVIGFGGYPTLPTMFAAILRTPLTCIHEQNGVMGRANLLISPRVDAIALSIAEPMGLRESDFAKSDITGNPVRQSVIDMRNAPYPSLDGDDEISLLIFGGSQGARIFSELIPEVIELLSPPLRRRLKITQQCRLEDEEAIRASYEKLGLEVLVATFFKDLPERIAKSHLVISRSGASTVSELSVIGRPAILVPLASALDGDQAANAAYFAKASAGWVFDERELTARILADKIADLIGSPQTLIDAAASACALGRPSAVQRLADLVDRLATRSSAGKTVWEAA
jgi:UDP-N-acetylglucosamine--N-acetylmuramyl-(pentapeptide) pyrophosphoryl-undecaprenol N-acetylglucosamine transferase